MLITLFGNRQNLSISTIHPNKPKMKKLDIVEAPDDVWPICPHCKEELRFIWVKSKGAGFIERKQFLLCPECRAFLGFGNIKYT